ncbi:hypothetical protein GXP74_06615 [Streptacidiphilus sp. P02-A3a]|nr:hypothetical protein GXP74_06615 [Streptacidiphilus sp. P02-A3a]
MTTPGAPGAPAAAPPVRPESAPPVRPERPRGLRALVGRAGPAPVRRLRVQAGCSLLLVAALLAAVLAAFGSARAEVRQLAAVSEPRAVAAADLDQALADLDAQHANQLVVGYPATPPPPGQEPVLVDDGILAEITAQRDRGRVSADLAALSAAGAADAGPVQSLLDGLSLYDGMSGTEQSSTTGQLNPVVGRPPALALDYYDLAEDQLQQNLLPRVRELLTVSEQQVAQGRAAAQRDTRIGALLVGLLALAALGLLVRWQLDLLRRHRRVFNPPLLLVSAVVLAVALTSVLALLGASGDVGAAVGDGYTPYAATAQAQVNAADAEASESRWLVDDAYRPLLQQQYTGLMRTLGAPDAPDAGVAAVIRTRSAYLAADSQLRALAGAGALDQASVQLTGVTRGEVAFAYYDFSTQLSRLAGEQLAVANDRFGAAVGDLAGWTVLPSVLLAAALLLVAVGVRPRLAEFS